MHHLFTILLSSDTRQRCFPKYALPLQDMVAAACATSTAVYMDPGTTVGNLAVWQVVPRPTTNQFFPNGQYNITSPARIARGCNGVLNAVACTAGANVNLDGGALGNTTSGQHKQ